MIVPPSIADRRPSRRDDISPISLVILLLLVAYQFVAQSGFIEAHLLKGKAKLHTHAAPARADAEAYITVDSDAKMDYVQFLLPSTFRSARELKEPKELVKSAEDEYRKTPKDPGLARRVVLLRAEAGEPDPLGPIPRKGKHKALPAPIAAFDYPDPQLTAPKAFLIRLFTDKQPIDAAECRELVREANADRTLRWYRHIALHQVYLRAGDKKDADRELRTAGHEAARSLLPVGVITIAMLMAGLIGLVLLIHQVIHSKLRASAAVDRSGYALPDRTAAGETLGAGQTSPAGADDSMWPAEPEPGGGVRKLGAGDLFNIFVCYMLAFAVLETSADVVVYSLFAHHPAYVRAHASSLELWVSFAHQVATAVCAFAVLLWYVKSRGTSVSTEVWLRIGPGWRNVAYGFAGWSMGLPLMAIAALVSAAVFSKLANPSNPVISMITSSQGFLPRFGLFFMACILAPVLEETMFRGAFYQAARARLGVWPAIIVTGILFGGIHPVGLAGAVPLMVLGSVFAWMAEKRKSLLPGMVAHFMINAMTYFQLVALSG